MWQIVLVSLSAVLAVPEHPAAPKGDLAPMQGHWVMASSSTGKRSDATFVARPVDIQASTIRFYNGHGEVETEATITLDSTKRPREINLLTAPRHGKRYLLHGIYVFEEGKLRIAFSRSRGNNVRPTDFTTIGGPSECAVILLERVK